MNQEARLPVSAATVNHVAGHVASFELVIVCVDLSPFKIHSFSFGVKLTVIGSLLPGTSVAPNDTVRGSFSSEDVVAWPVCEPSNVAVSSTNAMAPTLKAASAPHSAAIFFRLGTLNPFQGAGVIAGKAARRSDSTRGWFQAFWRFNITRASARRLLSLASDR